MVPALPPCEYTNPCHLFMHLDLLNFLLISPCCPHSLQDFHSSFLPCWLWLPAPAWPGRVGQGPRAPQPCCHHPRTLGVLHRWLWKFNSVTVFHRKGQLIKSLSISLGPAGKIRESPLFEVFKKDLLCCFLLVSLSHRPQHFKALFQALN